MLPLTIIDNPSFDIFSGNHLEFCHQVKQPCILNFTHNPGTKQTDSQPLVVSILAHGNELSGYYIMREIFSEIDKHPWRPLIVVVGNVQATLQGFRHLAHQPDFNRIWDKNSFSKSPEHKWAQAVVEYIESRNPIAAIDLHNNTGTNPLYSCVTSPAPEHSFLASLFSRISVLFSQLQNTQTGRLGSICPAVTYECGISQSTEGIEKAVEAIRACLHMHDIQHRQIPNQDLDMYRSKAVLRVHANVFYKFSPAQLTTNEPKWCLRSDLPQLNFSRIEPETTLGWSNGTPERNLENFLVAQDIIGHQVDDSNSIKKYFRLDQSGAIKTAQVFYPAMFTQDKNVIGQDALGYIMEKLDYV